MYDLALVNRAHWTWRFFVMLTLSVLVAVMGLLAGSAAVVIGAMLLAPLMTPVLGLAASLAMGLPRRITKSGLRVIVASLWCIALAYLASKITLTSADALSAEIEARTRPDLRDLIVALAAGFAGSYATVRTDTSSALPGVAVAVALVPPLATIGITLEAGNMVWARGAALLYLTNLAGIVLVGLLVFVATGFVPPRRLVTSVPRVLGALVLSGVAIAAISVPLLRASQSAADNSIRDRDGRRAVEQWLVGTRLEIQALDATGDPVVVEVSGPGEPPPREELERLVAEALGEGTQIAVFVDETREPTTTTSLIPSEEELRLAAAEQVVRSWLAANDNGSNSYSLDDFALEGSQLRVTVSGLDEAPPITDLIERLEADERLEDVVPSLRWSRLEEVPLGTVPPTELEIQTERLLVFVDQWAERNRVVLTSFDFDGSVLYAEIEGAAAPDLESLLLSVRASLVPVADVEVYFTQRVRLETTTTTTAPPTTSTTAAAVDGGAPAGSTTTSN